MQIHYDVDRIKHILQSLTRLTGISLSFMTTEEEYLCYCCPPDNFCGTLLAEDSDAEDGRCLCVGAYRRAAGMAVQVVP